jgi:hypothetical protein
MLMFQLIIANITFLKLSSFSKKMNFGTAHYRCKTGQPNVGQHMLTAGEIQMAHTTGLLSCNGNKGEN